MIRSTREAMSFSDEGGTIDWTSLERQIAVLRRSARSLASLEDLIEQNQLVIAELDVLSKKDGLDGIVVDMRQAPPRNDPEFEKAMAGLRANIFERFGRVAVLLSSAVGVLQVNRLARDEGVATFATLSESAAAQFAEPRRST